MALTPEQTLRHLRAANAVAQAALAKGKHPFGAVLVAGDGETVLLEQGNVDGVNHAEAVLARVAAHRFEAAQLWDCTLVTTVEPIAPCGNPSKAQRLLGWQNTVGFEEMIERLVAAESDKLG
jgi:tRNA(Arg) A34 adenosine deaminase TadA